MSEPHEHCACAADWAIRAQAECARLAGERDAAQAKAKAYEDGITWNTTCLNCAGLTNTNYAQYVELEQARAALKRFGRHRTECDFPMTFGQKPCSCGLVAALNAAPDARSAGSAPLETE